MNKARAKPIGPFIQYFAVAAGLKGQGDIELWIFTSWLDYSQPPFVVFANHRLLWLSLRTSVGQIQVVVAHALYSSFPKDENFAWLKHLHEVMHAGSHQRDINHLVD